MTHVALLGAGPAGLGAAYWLARRGIQVTLLERQAVVGGNAGSFELEGLQVDYGSHRLHPAAEPEILATLRELLGADLLERPRHGRILLMGHWLHFPLRAGDLLRRMPPRFALGVGMDLLRRALPERNATAPESFASVLRHGLGHTICQQFYFPYARKIWGLEPEEISPTQARKRVSSASLGRMLRRLLPGGTGGGAGRSRGTFFYPRGGYGQICEALLRGARQAGARLQLQARVTGVARSPAGGAARVLYQQAGEEHALDADHVWSTIPLPAFVGLLRPSAPPEVLEASRQLRFRAMLLVYLVLEQDRFSAYDAHYFPGAELRITRLSEPKNYSAATRPEGRTVLCAEIPCAPGDAIFSLPDAALAEQVRTDLERAGLPLRAPLRKVAVRRLAQAYPLYSIGYEEAFHCLDGWLSQQPGVLSFGRQGLYAHDNTHHALAMARAAVRCLATDGRFDTDAWARARAVFESHVVED